MEHVAGAGGHGGGAAGGHVAQRERQQVVAHGKVFVALPGRIRFDAADVPLIHSH